MCGGMDMVFHFLITLVVLCVVVGILLILVPWILAIMGVVIGDPIMRILRLIVAGIVCIFIIYLLWEAWDCFAGGGGLYMRR